MTFFGQPDYPQLIVESVSQYFFQMLTAVWYKKFAMTAAPASNVPPRVILTSLFFLEQELLWILGFLSSFIWFILSPITHSHLKLCIYRFRPLYGHRIAFRTLVMYWRTQDILIFFPKVILQTPFAFIIILFNILVHLTIHLLDIFQLIW